jgi:hypothetical protein
MYGYRIPCELDNKKLKKLEEDFKQIRLKYGLKATAAICESFLFSPTIKIDIPPICNYNIIECQKTCYMCKVNTCDNCAFKNWLEQLN